MYQNVSLRRNEDETGIRVGRDIKARTLFAFHGYFPVVYHLVSSCLGVPQSHATISSDRYQKQAVTRERESVNVAIMRGRLFDIRIVSSVVLVHGE